MSNTKLIAFYLPQFYPTPENDEWWEPGFTEWTNVARARPLFRDHYQPRIPRDLGFYDLRVPETREKQAELAKMARIEGFCYWHYWFGNGKRLLDLVFRDVVESGKPNFPFCLCWANHSWFAKTWDPNVPDKLLIEQTYPGVKDYASHFNEMLPAFKDKRYMKTSDGRLIFGVYKPLLIPDFDEFKNTWNMLALDNGLKGFYFFGFTFTPKEQSEILAVGYDSSVVDQIQMAETYNVSMIEKIFKHIRRELFGTPNHVVDYDKYARLSISKTLIDEKHYACLDPNFDHSPRSSNKGPILINNTPENWKILLKAVIEKGKNRENDFVFIKAWNEWGEGNYLEPDYKWGRKYIEATAEAMLY